VSSKLEKSWHAVERALAAAPAVDLRWLESLPPDDGWMLAPDALRFVAALVEELRPQHVLELGSGVSTRMLARAASAVGDCRVSSLENDPLQTAAASEAITRDGLAKTASVQFAPLVARVRGGKTLPSFHFDPAALASPEPFGLVLVDGPPAALGGREGVLYQFLELTEPGSLFVVDDASREQERAALAAWADNLGDAVEIRKLPSFAKGLVIVGVRRPLPSSELWAHRVALTRDELSEVVTEGGTFLLADGWALGDEVVPPGRRVIRYPGGAGSWQGEADGQDAAVDDLRRLAAEEVDLLAVTWPCAWWESAYPQLMTALRASPPILENDRVSILSVPRR
jgi:predicted O-methyltransferase YrrM